MLIASRRFVITVSLIYELRILLSAGSIETIGIALSTRKRVVPRAIFITLVAFGIVDLLIENVAIIRLAPLLEREGERE